MGARVPVTRMGWFNACGGEGREHRKVGGAENDYTGKAKLYNGEEKGQNALSPVVACVCVCVR